MSDDHHPECDGYHTMRWDRENRRAWYICIPPSTREFLRSEVEASRNEVMLPTRKVSDPQSRE